MLHDISNEDAHIGRRLLSNYYEWSCMCIHMATVCVFLFVSQKNLRNRAPDRSFCRGQIRTHTMKKI